ncbi:hypothetical protein N0V91_002823 [Didymella pomorum]|uniref:Uncharacterized protein n=1 Tax=Didymella pomorum TaxID=749634 RepID=A0A9W8ZLI8_9PLEO|nr:hypothetical protein N0V91_002823 [Didymella pomorum]
MLLFMVNLTLAVGFSFSIKDITVGRTRDLTEDDLVLVMASNTGASNYSNVFFLGPVEAAFVRGIVKVAAIVPGPQCVPAKLFELVLSFFGTDLFNCDGPVAVGNPTYTATHQYSRAQRRAVLE